MTDDLCPLLNCEVVHSGPFTVPAFRHGPIHVRLPPNCGHGGGSEAGEWRGGGWGHNAKSVSPAVNECFSCNVNSPYIYLLEEFKHMGLLLLRSFCRSCATSL